MGFRSTAGEVFHSLVDFMFPPACAVCGGSYTGENVICPICCDSVKLSAFSYSTPQRTVDHAYSVSVLLPYDSECRKLIHGLKYHNMPSIGIYLGGLLGHKTMLFIPAQDNAVIVPIPLHPAKFSERGYNQSERLARGFSRFTGHEIDESLIARTRETPTQTKLDVDSRRRNVSGAFIFNSETQLNGRDIILIDDVLTTGSTVSECAKVLKSGGAGKITVCVAATPEPGEDRQ